MPEVSQSGPKNDNPFEDTRYDLHLNISPELTFYQEQVPAAETAVIREKPHHCFQKKSRNVSFFAGFDIYRGKNMVPYGPEPGNGIKNCIL